MARWVERSSPHHKTFAFGYEGMAQGETSGPVRPGGADKSIVASGVFGAGSLALQGSNDPADPPASGSWVPVHDLQGVAIVFTAAGTAVLAENLVHYRLVMTGGGGTTDVDIELTSAGA